MPRIMARNIRAHATEGVPQEVCGLLGGEGSYFTVLARCPNHAPEPEHTFRMEPIHVYEFEKACAEKGLGIRALYHSHVGSGAEPSDTDIVGAESGLSDLYTVIYSVADDEIKVWRGRKPISLEVTG